MPNFTINVPDELTAELQAEVDRRNASLPNGETPLEPRTLLRRWLEPHFIEMRQRLRDRGHDARRAAYDAASLETRKLVDDALGTVEAGNVRAVRALSSSKRVK